MQDMYPNLPGVLAQFKDGGLVLRNQPTTQATESILLLGTAVDGPTLEPVAVDASTVEVLFGKSKNDNGTLNGATLVRAFEQAYSAGCRDVRVMRISGEKAKKVLEFDSVQFKENVAKEESITVSGSGYPVVLSLDEVPVSDQEVFIYFGETEITDFTVSGSTVTIINGTLEDGDVLTVNYYYEESSYKNGSLKVEGLYGGEIYNSVAVRVVNITNGGSTVIGKAFEISKPLSKKAQISEEDLSYSSLDYPTVFELVNAINSDAKNNVVRVSVAKDFENQLSTDFLETTGGNINLTGGANGVNLSNQQLFEALSGKRNNAGLLLKAGAYQLIENYKVDMVVPVGVYANEGGVYGDFAYELALACAVMSHRTNSTMGIIGTSSPTESGLKAVDSHVSSLLGISFDLNMKDRDGNDIKDTDGNTIDLGRYISILAGPDVTFASGRFGVYGENSAALYAGMISSLAPQSAPTNKNVPSAMGLRYTYSNAQLNALTGAKYVTFKFKSNNTVAVTDAMTAAQSTSDYRRLSTYRVVKTASNEVRAVCEPYIGEPNEVAQRNSMSAALDKRLGKLKEAGILVDYSFQIVVTPIMQILGQAQIELTLVPPMELRQITTVISLQPSGA